MRSSCRAGTTALLVALMAGCGGGGGEDNQDALEYIGIEEGMLLEYDIDIGMAVPQEGKVEVVDIDLEYADGEETYRVEMRQNNILTATRWYQVTSEGLFLLGEGVNEGAQYIERTYATPVKLVPYPLENEDGFPVQSWTTQTDVEEGGTEKPSSFSSG